MKLLWIVMLVAGTVFADADDDDKKESVGTVVGIDLGTTYSWLDIFDSLSQQALKATFGSNLGNNLDFFFSLSLVLGCSKMAVWRSSPMTRVTASLHLTWPSPVRESVWLEMPPRTSWPPTLKTRSLMQRDWLDAFGVNLLCSRTSSTFPLRWVLVWFDAQFYE